MTDRGGLVAPVPNTNTKPDTSDYTGHTGCPSFMTWGSGTFMVRSGVWSAASGMISLYTRNSTVVTSV